MGTRLRRSGKAGVTGLIIAIALVGSAWLAYAATGPRGGAYPTTAVRVKGHGQVGTGKHAATGFEFDISRSTTGELKGVLNVHCSGVPRQNFHSNDITSLIVVGKTASFTADGKLTGKGGKAQTITADATATDNSPDTFAVTIRKASNAVVCSASGPLTTGDVIIPFGKKK